MNKKIILYACIVIILALLLVLGFKAPKTSNKDSKTPVATQQEKQEKNSPDIDARAESSIFDFGDTAPLDTKENKETPKEPADEVTQPTEPVSQAELNQILAGFPLYEKAQLSFEAYRAFRRNNLVDLKEWDEAQVAGTPPLQVIGNGARGYFKVDVKDAKELLEFYSKSNLNINGWRYEGSFKEDIVNYKPEFKDNSLYAGSEKVERGKDISYAITKEKYFGTFTLLQPRFDEDFLVMYVDVTKE